MQGLVLSVAGIGPFGLWDCFLEALPLIHEASPSPSPLDALYSVSGERDWGKKWWFRAMFFCEKSAENPKKVAKSVENVTR